MFEIESNYKDNAGISQVVFTQAPLLDVELNELQQILNSTSKRIVQSIAGNGLTNANAFSYTDGTLTVSNTYAFVDGLVLKIDKLTKTASSGSIYLDVYEKVVTYNDTLKTEGNQQATTSVTNYIKDSRFNVETTRRKVLAFDLSTTNKTTGHHYLTLGTISNGAFTPSVSKVMNVKDLLNTINSILTRVSTLESDKADKSTLASASTNGLMSTTMYNKLAGISSGANKYVLPTATADNLGGVKIGSGIDINASVISVGDVDFGTF